MVNIRPLYKELQEKAAAELNEVESRIPEDLLHIRNWLMKQPHLKIRTEDQWIVSFLRGSKYSLEKTKSKLDLFYSIRCVSPEYYKNRYPFSTAINDILKMGCFMILPRSCSPPKPTLCLLRWDACNSENCKLTDLHKFWLMGFEILINQDDNAMVCGIEIIWDCSQFSQSYIVQNTPALVKKMLLACESAYPIRIKMVYVINVPSIFETVYAIMKLFMTDKLLNRMKIYGNNKLEQFYEDINRDVLPEDYGGRNFSVQKLAGDFNKTVESYGQWFLDDEKYCSIEALRPPDSRSPEDVLNMEGSFRKLNVD